MSEDKKEIHDRSVIGTIRDAPAYIARYIFGFVLAIFSDITTTSLAGGSACVGYVADSPLIGLAVFLLTHVAIRITNAINSAIVQQGRLIANSGHRLAQVSESLTSRPPTSEEAPVA